MHAFSKSLATFSMLLAFGFLAFPVSASAATLSSAQIQSIVTLLEAFNVDAATVAQVKHDLEGTNPTGDPAPTPPPTPAPPKSTHVPVIGSVYPSSAIGYDLSYNTITYPVERFGFAVVGVSHGKAFTHNDRLASEFSWAHFGSTVQPTIYMNLNAPYGSAVVGHIGGPKTCATQAAATGAEPTACEGYNYGYHAAADAYAYATASKVASPLWWLDIEVANSWSTNTEVNDQTIQGAIDYLNSQGLRVGIYSMGSMWDKIAGSNFVPTQTLHGNTVTTPTWLPVGIVSRVGAINACVTHDSFISGSPVWIVQYELSSTAIDQNLSC